MEAHNENKNNEFADQAYAYEVGIKAINNQANEHSGMRDFIMLCGQNIAAEKSQQLERLSTLSSYIADVFGDPADYDEQKAIRSAFLKGVVTGICVADQSYGEVVDIDDVVESIESERPNYATISDFYISQGPMLIEAGRQANDQMATYNSTIDKWEAECVTDIRYHHFYRMGFGIFMGSSAKVAHKIWQDTDLEFMDKEIESLADYDWDAAFSALDDDETKK